QDRTTVEAKLVLWRPLQGGEERALHEHLRGNMPEGIDVVLSFVEEIPRSEGGKYEDFVCNVRD
ncbi:MAG: hypothetical protein ACM35H_15645, partial [Bacteroidota bacterium]|nr:hypothetical protein [Kiloniellaceae bacterium]